MSCDTPLDGFEGLNFCTTEQQSCAPREINVFYAFY